MSSQNYVNATGVVLSLTTTPTSPLDTIWSSTSSVQALNGNSADDDFVIFFATDTVVVPATHGIYTITDSAWNTTYTLPSGLNNLIVNGSGQIASGNAQNNLIETGSGTVTVSGGGGNDVFVLGTGVDTIVDPQGSGSDVIYGFNAATDVVRLDGSTVFTGWSSIQAALQQVGSNVVLNMGNGQTLTFNNETVGALSSSDFDVPIDYAAMTETFDSEFTSFTASPSGNGTQWATTFPYVGTAARGPGADGAAYFSDSSVGYNPFSVSNGVLSITAVPASTVGSNALNLPYDTGVITSYKSFSQLYGYFEIKCELPAGQGLWPAFYMVSDSGAAELDILELLGSTPGILYPTVSDHATNTATNLSVLIPNSSTNFNTYGVDWEANTVTFYVNGNVVAVAPTPASMHVPMYMVAELDVGAAGSWAGQPTSNSIFPAAMQIDYIRAYATAATQDVGGTSAIPLPIAVTPTTESVTSTNGASVNPFSGVGISDDNASQTETATVTLSAAANGTLSDPNAATDGSKVVNGAWTITGSAAAVAAALDGLVFTPHAGQTVPSLTTTVTATIQDTAGQTAVATSTITATAIVPITVTPATESVTAANDASVAPFTGIVITDNNAGQSETATVTLSSAANGTLSDPNAATDGSTVVGGAWTITGSAAAVATALDGLVFTPASGQTAASVTTTVTATIKDTAGKTAVAASTITATPPPQNGTITAATLHYGAPTDASWGTGFGPVTVSLLNAAGVVIATTVSTTWGRFTFSQIGAGTYELQYTAPTGDGFKAGAPENPATGVTAPFTVAGGQTVNAPNGNFVSNTVTGSVLLSGVGEAGVTVSLLTTAGAVVATTTSGSGGAYSFTGMAAGSYQVAYTPPAGQAIDPAGPENTATGLTAPFTVAAGQTVTAPSGALVTNSVTGSVLLNGVGEAGVTVSLLTTAGTLVATTTSDSNGAYSFTGMATGSYQVDYTPPSGQIFDPAGPENTVTGLTAPFAVNGGQATAPTGELINNSIIGAVTLAGVAEAGVAVSLLTATGTVVATTSTNSAGGFSFAGLTAGSYEVSYTAPSGQVFQTGSEANAATGISPVVSLANGQVLTLPTEQLLSNPGTIFAAALHYGAPTDNAWGTGLAGVTVSLLNAAGTVIATAVSDSVGHVYFRQIGAGTYQLQYTAPAGAGFLPTGPDTATGLTAQFTVAAGGGATAPGGDIIGSIVMNGSGLTELAPAGGYLVTGNASNSTLTLGNGSQFVTLTGGGDTVTTGTGNQTISLGGNNNTVSVGTGNNTITLTGTGNTVTDTGGSGTSTFNAGSGNDAVHVTGGTDNITINATGSGNLFDAGPGLNFLNADGSAGNTFMLNAATQASMSLTTITGFNTAGDILDLKRTLAGTSILPDLSNVGSLVTSAFSGANTMLYAAPSGGGSPVAFAALNGVHVTVAQLLAAHDFSLS